MRIQEKLLNSNFGRNLLAVLSLRSKTLRYEYEFEAYFQYKIGPYERGHMLYFTKQPNKRDYKNEIFSKMREFEGHDLAGYLDYHYAAYKNKKEFIRFLRYEIQEILKFKPHRSYRLLLETAFEWVKEQEVLLPPTDQESALSETEIKMEEIIRSYAGKIVFNNQHHKEKFIQVLILLQNLKAPGKKAELLFHRFTATDMTSILRQVEGNTYKKTSPVTHRRHSAFRLFTGFALAARRA